MTHVGGLWERRVDGVAEFGLLAEGMHANRNEVVHGGMLMTIVDRAFGQSAREASGAPRTATISLSTQFAAPMRIGSFAILRPRIVRLTARLAFVEGAATCKGEVLVSAQGVWRLARST